MTRSMPRRAFTLIELLVVTGILASLLGLVAIGSRPGRQSQIRRAAQSLASVLVAAQSKAIGNEAGASVILDPSSDTVLGSTEVFNADTLPFIKGTTASNDMPPSNAATASAPVTITPTNADVAELQNGYKILFYESGLAGNPAQAPTAWMQFTPSTSASGTVSFRTGAGQTVNNMIWPKPVTPPFDVLIARYPIKSTSAALLPKLAAVDLRYSGIGDDTTAPYGSLNGKGSIALVFDRVGGVDALMQQVLSAATARTNQPVDPTVPVYFLVAAKEDIAANANTLASDDSTWVAVNPLSGRVHVSANVPQSTTPITSTVLRAARANARMGIQLGK